MKQSAYHFFLKHAGYSYDSKTETPLQGRRRCARSMAADEKATHDGGFSYRWSIDPNTDSSDFSDETPAWSLWQCGMYNERGQIVASLHGIDFGRDREPWGDPYKRVVEVELASDGLTNEPQGGAAMSTIARLIWDCPHCHYHNEDEQDDEQGPFISVTCTDCGRAFEQAALPDLLELPT